MAKKIFLSFAFIFVFVCKGYALQDLKPLSALNVLKMATSQKSLEVISNTHFEGVRHLLLTSCVKTHSLEKILEKVGPRTQVSCLSQENPNFKKVEFLKWDSKAFEAHEAFDFVIFEHPLLDQLKFSDFLNRIKKKLTRNAHFIFEEINLECFFTIPAYLAVSDSLPFLKKYFEGFWDLKTWLENSGAEIVTTQESSIALNSKEERHSLETLISELSPDLKMIPSGVEPHQLIKALNDIAKNPNVQIGIGQFLQIQGQFKL